MSIFNETENFYPMTMIELAVNRFKDLRVEALGKPKRILMNWEICKSKAAMPASPVPQILSTFKKHDYRDWVKLLRSPVDDEVELLIARNGLQDAKVACFCAIEPILQNGPQCGLVALAMASCDYFKPLTVTQLYEDARLRGFTQHGEVFSVDFMDILAAEHLPDCKPNVLENLQSCSDSITDALVHGDRILIPYDSDFNHAPCLKRGHKAHWALLVGLVSSRQGYYVLARHGKSRHLACWSLRDLIDSNGNLMEEGVARHNGGYVIPKGGVGGRCGLKGRAVVLHSIKRTKVI